MGTETRGGKRQNAGRKSIPADKKKKQLSLFVEQGIIDDIGGEDATKQRAYAAIYYPVNRWDEIQEKIKQLIKK